jgi:Mg-chelatase subunit ChlD
MPQSNMVRVRMCRTWLVAALAVGIVPLSCGGHDAGSKTLDTSPSDASASGQGAAGGDDGGAFDPTGSGSFGSGQDGQAGSESTCAHVNVDIARIVPDVWLMVDGSGSMADPLQAGGASKYSLLRDALVDMTTGLVPALQTSIAFGLFEYDGCAYNPAIIGPGCVAGACPRVTSVNPGIDNFTPIAMAYPPAPPGASTPTDVALAALGQRIGANASSAKPGPPTYVVLATDGEPNLCDWHDGVPSNAQFQQNALAAVQSMVASGTEVFVVSLAGSDANLEAYLNQVAAAGGTGQPAFTPMSEGDLVAALQQILGGTVSCSLSLTGMVVAGMECSGSVTLDGKPLKCDDPNGWHLKDSQTIDIVGTACDALRGKPMSTLSASFPCAAYNPPK